MSNQPTKGGVAPATMVPGDSIRSLLSELRRLHPEHYRGHVVPMRAAISPGETTGTDSYRAPPTHHFIVLRASGIIALQDIMTETLSVSPADATKGVGSLNASERLVLKACNAEVELTNSDRQTKIIDGHPLPLISILPGAGGQVLEWDKAPHIVLAGETLQLDVRLIQSDAKIVGGKTAYGVLLEGFLVRVKES
jgi:hypothetical protein